MRSIADLAFLSDSRTAALLDRHGTVVWYCPRRFDGPAVFSALLDDRAGHWRLAPHGEAASRREYVGESLMLRTQHESAEGSVEIIDFLALDADGEPHDLGRKVPHALVRLARGLRGRLALSMELEARFEYGLTVPHVELRPGSARLSAGPLAMQLRADAALNVEDGRISADLELAEGDSAAFVLTAWNALDEPPPEVATADRLLDDTRRAWSSWIELHRSYEGPQVELVRRSALVLQGLTDARTGAVLGAASSSLPERIGGSWNWDYRYAWLRDLSFVVRALWVAACPTEGDRFLRFLAASLGRLDDAHVPIVLGSDGRRDLGEHVLTHLRGYRDSAPVRVGNDAWGQRQLDVLGEVIDSVHLFRERIEALDDQARQMLVGFAERAARDWRLPDAGMWEARDRQRHYTSSKVMCWVALDRAIALSERLGDGVAVDRWRRERDAVREEILDEAWSERANAYAGAFGSDELDASVLLMPLVGFLPADDARMTATIDAVAERLTSGPLVHRWDGDPNGFLLCSYWLVECEALLGRRPAAQRRLDELNRLANDLGLLSEMIAADGHEMLGNFPQAFSHVGLVNAAWRLAEREGRADDHAPAEARA